MSTHVRTGRLSSECTEAASTEITTSVQPLHHLKKAIVMDAKILNVSRVLPTKSRTENHRRCSGTVRKPGLLSTSRNSVYPPVAIKRGRGARRVFRVLVEGDEQLKCGGM